MKMKIIKRISFATIYILLFAFGLFISTDKLSSQNYYMNNSDITEYEYYKEVKVERNGTIKMEGRYNVVLGEFLYGINSQNVYKVGLDDDGEIVKYYKKSRIYIPRYYVKGGVIRELEVKVPGTNNNQLRIYEYEKGKMIRKDVYIQGVEPDGITRKMVKDQSVYYDYYEGLLSKEVYRNFNKGRNVSEKYAMYTYNGKTLKKKEIYNSQDILEYYYTYSGNVTTHHKPDGTVVREHIDDNSGYYTIEYYPAILKNMNGRYIIDAEERYDEGVKVGFFRYKGVIARYKRILPHKNGYTLHDYAIAEVESGRHIMLENIHYKRAFTWEEASTIVQKPYLIDPSHSKPQVKELPFKWLDDTGYNLMDYIPTGIKRYVEHREQKFIGAEYAIYGEIEQGAGNSTLVEVYNEEGDKNWCDLYGTYLFFIGKLSDTNGLNYNRIVIRSKGYKDYHKDFEISTNEKRIFDIGRFYMTQ
ncbi:MAG: hypothetical protein ACOCV8_00890 [Spirochaetota bacterium]